MLKQDEGVTDGAGLARGDYFRLYPQSLGIRNASELKQMHVHDWLQAEIGETGVIVRTAPGGPVKQFLGWCDGEIVDAGMARGH